MRKIFKKLLSTALSVLLVAGCIAPASVGAADGFTTNLDSLKGLHGTWTLTDDGFVGTGSGDCYAMSQTKVKNFIFEADVKIESGNAASLVFGSRYDSPDTGRYCYVANVDLGSRSDARIFKFDGGNVSDVGVYPISDKSITEYHMRIEFIDGQMRYFLNDMLVVSATDTNNTYTEGYLGLMIANSTTVYDNVNYIAVDDSTPRLTGLEIDGVDFEPAFSADNLTYTAQADLGSANIALKPEAAEGVTFEVSKYNDNGRLMGVYPAEEVPLSAGFNKLVIRTFKDGKEGVSTLVNIVRALDPENAYNETYRPQYHITPEYGWLNDPNGLVYVNGEWHVFYQYNPHKVPEPENQKYWAHVASTDLVNWEARPMALEPDMYGSIWSGSIVVDEKNCSGLFDDAPNKQGLIAYYTVTPLPSTRPQQQAMAYSVDGGNTWTKYNGGAPVLTVDQDPTGDGNFRDPKIFWHEESNQWMMVIAGGPLRFYSSTNLIDWKCESYNKSIGTECADFFKMPVDDDPSKTKWVLSRAGQSYMIGDFRVVNGGWTFVPDSNTSYDINVAPDAYAAQSFYGTPDGRRILIYWMADLFQSKSLANITDPWNGALTLPYEAKLVTGANGQIRMTLDPVDELDDLRGDAAVEMKDATVSEDTLNPLKDVTLNKFELEATIDVGTAEDFGIVFRAGNNQQTVVSYNTASRRLTLDRSESGAYPAGSSFLSAYSREVQPVDGKLKLHMYVDHSSVELFTQDGAEQYIALIFPDATSSGMELYANGGSITVEELNIYPMDSIYHEETAPESVDEMIVTAKTDTLTANETATVWAVSDPIGYDFGEITWRVSDENVLEIIEDGDSAIVRAKGDGVATVTATAGKLTGEMTFVVKAQAFRTNLTGWSPVSGDWKMTDNGYEGNCGFNQRTVAAQSASDFVYEGTFTYTNNDIGTALIFRINEDSSVYYSADVCERNRNARILKFTRNADGGYSDVTLGNVYSLPLTSDRTYTTRIVAQGANIKMYINDVLAVECTDSASLSGKFGLQLCDAGGIFQDVYYTESAALDELSLSDGTVLSDFSASLREYAAQVDMEITHLRMTLSPGATVTVNGAAVATYNDQVSLPLSLGMNAFEVVVSGAFETSEIYRLTIERAYLPGDVDFSGVVDVADILKLKDMIMSEEWDSMELAVGDLNESASLDVGDIMGIKDIIMKG